MRELLLIQPVTQFSIERILIKATMMMDCRKNSGGRPAPQPTPTSYIG